MPTDRRRPLDEGRLIQLVYHAYVVASWVARALPEPLVYAGARATGRMAARFSKKRAAVARNLAHITGEPVGSAEVQRLVDAAFQSYARYWLETFRLVREGRDFFLERVRSETRDRLHRTLAERGGAIVVVGHLGNWDAGGAWVGAWGGRLVTVAEVLRPRRMFEFFKEHRARLGMTIYPAEKGATEKLAEDVRNGAVVAILGDRALHRKGPEVKFFGEVMPMPAGPASVAFKSGVPVLVAGVYGIRLPDGRPGWQIDFSEPIELPPERTPEAMVDLTQRIAFELEACIRKRPEEWHVFQDFWPSQPGERNPPDRSR